MAKINTIGQLQDALDTEMAWRIKEIGAFHMGSKSNGSQRKPFIRAGIALLYAHWEGFIKCASELYLSFVESRGHSYRELKTCFSVFGLKGKLDTLVEARKSEPNIAAMEFVMNELGGRAKLKIASAVRTDSNLTSTVFANIARSLDIKTEDYETKFNLIDTSLVLRRNKVAHGEYL
ncbi:MAG: MAE_28990/MAE_18760 family HEPN-like nuclease, partial [Lentilitoribacter sp.]